MPKNNSNGQAAVARMSDGKARIEMILSDKTTSTRLAFTLLEIIIVIAIIAVAALFAVPMFSQAADVQLRTAANMVAADIEYAKSLAITRQQPHSVVFDTVNHAYKVCDETGTPVAHPISFGADPRLKKVRVAAVNFDGAGDNAITFDYLGSPSSATRELLDPGTVTLAADGMTLNITIEPVTGYVSIN